MKSVAIIGGGITGLTAAFHLRQRNIPVTLYEASGRAGGVIQSVRQNGYLAECGPNTILEIAHSRSLAVQHWERFFLRRFFRTALPRVRSL